jgi:glycosyltransferase involved in cell wall biosynthesis
MSTAPHVSVIIPVYNAQGYVGEAVRSVVAQTYPDLEIVVVDDASTDSSVAEVLRVDDRRVRLLRNRPKGGQSRARNIGLEAARGHYVALLDADDTALPERIARQVAYLDRHESVGLLGTSYRYLDQAGALQGAFHVPENPTRILLRLLVSNPIGTSTIMMRREVLDVAGGFDPDFVFAEDLEYWGRVALATRIAQIDAPLTAYRVHEGSLSSATPNATAADAVAHAHQNNVRRLTGLEVGLGSLTLLAGGTPSSDAELLAAYTDLDVLAAAFVRRYAHDASSRRLVLSELAMVLLKLARVNDHLRLRAIRSVGQYVRDAGLGVGVSPSLWSLVARVLPPQGARDVAKRFVRAGQTLR